MLKMPGRGTAIEQYAMVLKMQRKFASIYVNFIISFRGTQQNAVRVHSLKSVRQKGVVSFNKFRANPLIHISEIYK